MTLAELTAYVGAPAVGKWRVRKTSDGLVETSWEGAVDGQRGWWWALCESDQPGGPLLAMGWTSGRTRERDVEVARALVERPWVKPAAQA